MVRFCRRPGQAPTSRVSGPGSFYLWQLRLQADPTGSRALA